jgi:tetratricopeptide (TPR) repeat protein
VLLVGHYQGDTIISAEAQIDRRLSGRLTRRKLLGLYPGPLNTSHFFKDTVGTFPGAIVLGLGKVGELTSGTLTDTYYHALVDYALGLLEDAGYGPQADRSFIEAKVSSLLIGTTAGGLSIRDAVTAMLRALQRVSEHLVRCKLDDRLRFTGVEIIELYLDRALEAAGKLNEAIRDPDLDGAFEPVGEIVSLDGGRRRVTFEESPGWWDRLQILADPDGRLRFTALTERARAEVSLLPTQRALVDRFISQAIASTSSDDRVASTLFELLLPNVLKEHAREQRNVVLVLNDAAAAYPWELVHDGLTGRAEGETVDERHAPLAIQAGMIRQRETEEYRRRVAGTLERNMLVVGDPDLSDPQSQLRTLFPALAGAKAEADEVAKLSKGRGYDVWTVINGRSDEIVRELFARPYRVLHLAGHGAYEFVPLRNADGEPVTRSGYDGCDTPEALPVSGMVIGRQAEISPRGEARDRYVLLTPAEIEQMRFVPELVFINCCFGGMDRSGYDPVARDDRHRLAANVSTQLIRMGVRAVIAAGWAVDDAAAVTFARTFYQRMLDGETFGWAVQQARKKAYLEHGTVNTWGAYQCYGDPDYRLVANSFEGGSPTVRPSWFAKEALIAEIDNLVEEAKTVDTVERVEALRKTVRQLADSMPAKWREWGAVNAALGRAYGELDQFAEAVESYQRALAAPKGGASLDAVEQLANLKARWAVALYRKRQGANLSRKQGDEPRPGDLIQEAIGHLALLMQFAPTPERHRLMGSAHKRASLIAPSMEQRIKAIQAMGDSYAEAAKLEGKKDSYTITNILTARFLLGLTRSDPTLKEDAARTLDELAAGRGKESDQDRSFWTLSAIGDELCVRELIGGTLADHCQAIEDAYLEARRRAVSPRQWRSILEHFDFLIETMEQLGPRSKDAKLASALVGALKLVAGELRSAA